MKILIADDDRVFQVLLKGVAARWGYETVIVTDGESAWQQLNQEDGPRLALLDWEMPGIDGPEICRRIRQTSLSHYVYVILLTARTGSQSLVAGLRAGADDYLSKPIDLPELEHRLRAGSRMLDFEERHRLIAETASDGILSIDADDRILFANRAAGTIFGYAVADLIGQPLSRFIPAGPQAPQDNDGTATPQAGLAACEVGGRHSSGADLLLEVSISRAGEKTGGLLTAVIRDVTERRRKELERAQAQKLESVGALASGVAHEINTPIQYIGDNLQFLKESCVTLVNGLELYQQLLTSGRQHEEVLAEIESFRETSDLDYLSTEIPAAIQQALEGASRVAEIVRAMKEFSHPGKAEMAPADLNHVIETAVLLSKNRWKYIADLNTHLDPDLPLVACDCSEVSQVLLNLIVNACDAIADASKVRAQDKGRIDVSTHRKGDMVEIWVSDTGTGIRPEIRSRIFDPFFTTKEVGQGTGQGLAIAHAIVVQKHHGAIELETEDGAGSTFIVRLPIGDCTGLAVIPEAADLAGVRE
jgi:two-component system NtrC family sensor kinase